MRKLSSADELQQAESAFRAVFARVSNADPFQPRLGARLLLYPIDNTLLDAQFEAVATASIHAGVERPYFAGYGGEEAGWGGTYGHRLVDVRSYDDYRYDDDGFLIIEHFLFAPRGEWGLVTSHGEYAIVAGTETFIDDLRSALGYDEVRALGDLVSDWREIGHGGGSVEWVPRLLNHVLGAGKGPRLWERSS